MNPQKCNYIRVEKGDHFELCTPEQYREKYLKSKPHEKYFVKHTNAYPERDKIAAYNPKIPKSVTVIEDTKYLNINNNNCVLSFPETRDNNLKSVNQSVSNFLNLSDCRAHLPKQYSTITQSENKHFKLQLDCTTKDPVNVTEIDVNSGLQTKKEGFVRQIFGCEIETGRMVPIHNHGISEPKNSPFINYRYSEGSSKYNSNVNSFDNTDKRMPYIHKNPSTSQIESKSPFAQFKKY